MAGGLSEDQVASELTKMVEFIKKEADEKAKEIRIKAGEEYEIEKADIVRSEIASIDQVFEQRYKQAAMNEQIVKSTTANKTRLKVLAAKEEILDKIFADAEQELKKIASDKSRYQNLLTSLIKEGAELLKEKEVTVRVRKEDLDLAKKAADSVLKDDKIKVDIDEANELPGDIAGGAVISAHQSKLLIDNTLEERLKLLSDRALPRIRLELFGPSKTRKYFE